MPLKPCLEPRCPNFSEAKYRGRCKQHHLERERERMARRRADPNRGKRVKLYHSKRWAVTRKKVLFEQPVCADPSCIRLSTEVDHITALSRGGAEFDRDNLQGLCGYHHALKSGQESVAAKGGFPDAA